MALPEITQMPSSERIELRIPDERDVDLVVDASTDALIPLITTVPPSCSARQARDFITRQQRRPAHGEGWSFTIVDRRSGRSVGNLYISCRSIELGAVEVGYWVGPSHRGRGHAAATLALVREWALTEFGVDRLMLYIDPENAPSLRTADRAGFQLGPTYDRWERVGNDFRPMTVWSHGPGSAEPALIGRLEHRMWQGEYRGDPRWFDHHLHPDFLEHGCSGTRWTRENMVATPIGGAIAVRLPLAEQHVQQLASHTWMMTYVAHQPDRSCRRTSIWQELATGWCLRFHQATRIPGGSGLDADDHVAVARSDYRAGR